MISFVYFDLGGVVEIDISTEETWGRLKRDIGITVERDGGFKAFWAKHEPELWLGKDVDSLVPLLQKEFDLNLPKNYSMLDDFVSRFEENRSIWPVIAEIQKKCKVGLLTNMYPRMFEKIRKRKILPDVHWDVTIDSVVVGLQKPQRDIYRLAEKESGFSGQEILFVDNSKKNVDSAKDFGWLTFLYDPAHPVLSSKKLLDFFRENI